MLNKLLQRQLHKFFGDTVPGDLTEIFQVISESYDHYEKDRKMLERSIDLSSNEMIEINDVLRKEKDNLNLINERLSEAQQIAHLGSWLWDVKNNIILRSAEFYRIFEISQAQFPSAFEDYLELIHPNDRQYVSTIFNQSLKDHKPFTYEARIILADGRIKTIVAQGKILDTEDGEIDKMYGTVQDITEQKQSQLALEKAHSEMQTLFNNIDELFFSVSFPDYKLLQMSSACQKIYGYPLETFQKNSNLWYELVLDEDKKIIDANFPVMHQGKAFTQVYRIQNKDGAIKWVETKIT